MVASFLLYVVISLVFFYRFHKLFSYASEACNSLLLSNRADKVAVGMRPRIWVLRVQSMGLREKYPESRRKFSLIPLEALTRPHTYVYSHD